MGELASNVGVFAGVGGGTSTYPDDGMSTSMVAKGFRRVGGRGEGGGGDERPIVINLQNIAPGIAESANFDPNVQDHVS